MGAPFLSLLLFGAVVWILEATVFELIFLIKKRKDMANIGKQNEAGDLMII